MDYIKIGQICVIVGRLIVPGSAAHATTYVRYLPQPYQGNIVLPVLDNNGTNPDFMMFISATGDGFGELKNLGAWTATGNKDLRITGAYITYS